MRTYSRLWEVHGIRAALVLCVATACQQPATASQPFSFNVDAGVRWEDNLSLSPKGKDKVDDVTTHIGFSGDYEAFTTNTSQFTIGAGVYYDYVSDTTDLSNYGAKLSLLYRHEFGTSLTAPWFSLGGDGQWLEYKDSDIRDGYIVTGTATIGKRLNRKVGISGGYKYFIRRSTDDSPDGQGGWCATVWPPGMCPPSDWNDPWKDADEVFDLDRHNFFARIDFAMNEATRFYGDLTYFDGDVAASGRSFNNGARFSRAKDSAFGGDYVAWQIDADGFISKLGVSHSFTEKFSIDAFVEYLTADGESGNDYENTAIQALGVYRF
jgi:hypothetical protein